MPTIQLRTPAGDVVAVDESLEDYYGRQGWVRELTQADLDAAAEEAQELKGAALDAALKDAGISGAGLTADEKRAALADHHQHPEEG